MKKILYPAVIYFMMGLSIATAEEVKLTTILPQQDQLRGRSGVVGNGYGSAFPYNWDWRTVSLTDNQFYVGGNVGIGTTNPCRVLHLYTPHVNGVSAPSSEMVMEVTNGASNYRKWNFVVDGGSSNAQEFCIRQLSDSGGGYIPFRITGGTGPQVQLTNTSFYTDTNGYHTIDANTGYGILNIISPYGGVLINSTPSNMFEGVIWSSFRETNNPHSTQSNIWRRFAYQTGDQIIFSDDALYGNGQVYSDIRLKEDIVTIPDALERLQSIRGVNFRWKKGKGDNALHAGMIAQEVEKVFPEVVQTGQGGMKSIAYDQFMGVLVEAVKNLKKDDDELKSQTKSLADRIALLEKDK